MELRGQHPPGEAEEPGSMVADGHSQALRVVALQDVQGLHADLHPSWALQRLPPRRARLQARVCPAGYSSAAMYPHIAGNNWTFTAYQNPASLESPASTWYQKSLRQTTLSILGNADMRVRVCAHS